MGLHYGILIFSLTIDLVLACQRMLLFNIFESLTIESERPWYSITSSTMTLVSQKRLIISFYTTYIFLLLKLNRCHNFYQRLQYFSLSLTNSIFDQSAFWFYQFQNHLQKNCQNISWLVQGRLFLICKKNLDVRVFLIFEALKLFYCSFWSLIFISLILFLYKPLSFSFTENISPNWYNYNWTYIPQM